MGPPSIGSGITLWIALSWLTDANDVDLHVIDPNGEDGSDGREIVVWAYNQDTGIIIQTSHVIPPLLTNVFFGR